MPIPDTPFERQAQLLQRQTEQFFQATTDAIFFLDRQYRFTYLNHRATQLISQGKDLRGLNLFEEFPGAVYPGSPFVEHYTRAMEQGHFAEFTAPYGEPLNLLFRVQAYPVDDGIMVFFRDVTREIRDREDLHRKSLEAQRQHAELESIYRTAPIGLALFDLDDYRYLRLNDRQAAFYGLKPEEIVGTPVTEMAPIPGLRELFDGVRNGTPVINYQLEGSLVTDPDTHRYWTVSYFPVYGADGVIQAITSASLEITQQKKAEVALIQSEKLAAVGRLASSIAHEINNPLEAITNLLYLAEHSGTLEEARTFILTAEVELRRVSAITQQTLRFHKQSTDPLEISLDELIGSVLSVFQGRIANSRVDITPRVEPHRHIRCFEGEIRQVLSNIISNALDAMPGGGHLSVRARETTAWSSAQRGVKITIADTGTGMSPQTQARLFNAFFTTKGITGTGLGLWVSKEIVDRHRGSLRIRSSESPAHHGTIFTLFLPYNAVVR